MTAKLTYLYLFLFGLFFFACQDENESVLDMDHSSNVKVSLRIFYPISSRAFEDAGTDPETSAEREVDEKDVYVLLFQKDILVEHIKDLKVVVKNAQDPSVATGELSIEGECPMPVGGGPLELVFFANLKQKDNLDGNQKPNEIAGVHAIIDQLKGQPKEVVYKSLKYNYDPLSYDYNSNVGWAQGRRIPMWGTTGYVIQGGENHVSCNLHRALSKFVFQINGGKGYTYKPYGDRYNRRISRIVLSSSSQKPTKLFIQGYCAPLKDIIDYSDVPSVTDALKTKTLTTDHTFYFYDNDPANNYYIADYREDEDLNKSETIYFPEQLSFPKISIFYQKLFDEDLLGRYFWEWTGKYKNYSLIESERIPQILEGEQVIRNHSYVFNMKNPKEGGNLDIKYEVLGWRDKSVDMNFGKDDGNVLQ